MGTPRRATPSIGNTHPRTNGPTVLGLDAAVREITQIVRDSEKNRPPFFFITGAGISHGSVLLSSEITKHCKDKALAAGNPAPTNITRPIDAYSAWMQLAYSTQATRQKYLKGLIHAKPITEANFRLAHILADGSAARIAVTTNFDDLLHKALRLFGQDVILCDHPATAFRIDHDQKDAVQVVHVHGMYWGYDLANLTDDIQERATEDGFDSMAALMDKLLASTSPIIIGYSGWEGDVFTTSLQRRMKTANIPNNFYWFCYNDADETNARALVGALPGAKHLRLVRADAHDEPHRGAVLAATSARGREQDRSPRTEKDERLLDANAAFKALTAGLKLDPPKAATHPVHFLQEQLRRAMPTDAETRTADPYLMQETLAEVGRAVKLLQSDRSKETQEQRLREAVADLVRRQAWDEWEKVAGTRNPLEFDSVVAAMTRDKTRLGPFPAALDKSITAVPTFAGADKITVLSLDNTQVTDAGLGSISAKDSPLTALQMLSLDNTKVTDAGLRSISAKDSPLTALRGLSLINTQVTYAGIKALEARFRNITVFR